MKSRSRELAGNEKGHTRPTSPTRDERQYTNGSEILKRISNVEYCTAETLSYFKCSDTIFSRRCTWKRHATKQAVNGDGSRPSEGEGTAGWEGGQCAPSLTLGSGWGRVRRGLTGRGRSRMHLCSNTGEWVGRGRISGGYSAQFTCALTLWSGLRAGPNG